MAKHDIEKRESDTVKRKVGEKRKSLSGENKIEKVKEKVSKQREIYDSRILICTRELWTRGRHEEEEKEVKNELAQTVGGSGVKYRF